MVRSAIRVRSLGDTLIALFIAFCLTVPPLTYWTLTRTEAP